MKNYIVLDLEWNQSPDGKEGTIDHFPFEIIEIGAVRLDEERKEIGEFRRLIRPRVYPQMHYRISEVTHMDMAELERNGETFETVIRDFLEWCGDDCIFCTWGSMDLTELQRNMVYYGVEIPFDKPLLYYDVQKLYSLLQGDGKQKQSLDITVEELGIREDRPFHRALDDAAGSWRPWTLSGCWNTGQPIITGCRRVRRRRSIWSFPDTPNTFPEPLRRRRRLSRTRRSPT